MPANPNLASYLRLLDWTSRLFRRGKARLPADVADILSRLGSSPDLWQSRMERLRKTTRLFGVAFATKRDGLHEMASTRGVSKLANVNNCPE